MVNPAAPRGPGTLTWWSSWYWTLAGGPEVCSCAQRRRIGHMAGTGGLDRQAPPPCFPEGALSLFSPGSLWGTG